MVVSLLFSRPDFTSSSLTLVTLVSGVSGVTLAAEGAPVGEARRLNAAGRTGRRHTHAVRQPAAGAAVHALTWRRQVVHLRGRKEEEGLLTIIITVNHFPPDLGAADRK